jgi:hypothetical protein
LAWRRVFARRELGERVARGRKRGFGVPAQRWMLGRWRRTADDALLASTLAEDGWLRRDALAHAWQRAVVAGAVPLPLWYVYVLELWYRRERALGGDASFTSHVSRSPAAV